MKIPWNEKWLKCTFPWLQVVLFAKPDPILKSKHFSADDWPSNWYQCKLGILDQKRLCKTELQVGAFGPSIYPTQDVPIHRARNNTGPSCCLGPHDHQTIWEDFVRKSTGVAPCGLPLQHSSYLDFKILRKKKFCQLRVKSALTQPSKKVGPALTMGTGLLRPRDKGHKAISMGSCQLSDHWVAWVQLKFSGVWATPSVHMTQYYGHSKELEPHTMASNGTSALFSDCSCLNIKWHVALLWLHPIPPTPG